MANWRALIGILGLLAGTLLAPPTLLAAQSAQPLPAPTTRPNAESGPTRVELGFWIADVSQIDSLNQTFTANVLTLMTWTDARLAHTQGELQYYRLEDVWHPPFLTANTTEPPALTLPEVVEVTRDGVVTYRQRVLGTYSQSLDLRRFPFDQNTFHVQLVTPGFAPSDFEFVAEAQLVAAGMPSGVGIASEISMPDWSISAPSAVAHSYRLAPGHEIAGYQLQFQAERHSRHYVIKVIIPLILIVLMSWAAFWLDPSLASSQISVSVTSMLTLIAYRFSIGSEVPKLPYLTRLDAFTFACTLLVFMTLIEVILTSHLALQGRKELARRIDVYSRVVFPIGLMLVMLFTLGY